MFNVNVDPNGPILDVTWNNYNIATPQIHDQKPGDVSSFQDASPEVANDIPSEKGETSSPLKLEAVPRPQKPFKRIHLSKSEKI